MLSFKIGKTKINRNAETYFIADIAANHDGSLARAKKLIRLCAKAGANAAKFQHFKAETIVSDKGFKDIGKLSHQKKWKKSVFEIYKDARRCIVPVVFSVHILGILIGNLSGV